KSAEDTIRESTVVINGDILTDVDISKLINLHKEKSAEATIALTPIENPSAYGLVETDDEQKVLRFREKPKPEELENLTTKNINAGIYILEPTVLDLIPKGENHSFEYNLFPNLLEKKKAFFAFIMKNEYWRDIGTAESYLNAHQDFINEKIKGFEIPDGENSDIATAAFVSENSVVGDNCIIKPNAKIINSILGEGVHVEEKAIIENSIIWAHTHVANSAEISRAVIGRSCYIGQNASVGKGAVLGDKTSLTDYTKV
ncbi:MAG: sugar phosphate nucleotidyltransferase, partial [Pyrinomonadaceae bacterium]